MERDEALPRVLVLGPALCGKSTLLKALASGRIPSRPPGRTVGAFIETVLVDALGPAEENETMDEPDSGSAVALIEPDSSPEQRHAASVYFDLVNGVLLAFDAGRPSSWQDALQQLQRFVSHVLKRQLQFNIDRKRNSGLSRIDEASEYSAAADTACARLSAMPILLVACRTDLERGAVGQGSADRAASFVDSLLSACLCQCSDGIPQPRLPPRVRGGGVTRQKVRIPLPPRDDVEKYMRVEGMVGKAGVVNALPLVQRLCSLLSCCCAPPPKQRIATLDVRVIGVAAQAARTGLYAGGTPQGLLAPMDVLEDFLREVIARKARGGLTTLDQHEAESVRQRATV